MTGTDPDDPLTAAAASLFAHGMTLAALRAGTDRDDDRRPVVFADLFAYATGSDAGDDARIEAAVAGDVRLRAGLDHLLDKLASARLPRVAAAATGPIGERRSGDLVLRLHPSRADRDQIYVVLAMPADWGAGRRHLIIRRAGAAPLRLALEVDTDGGAQTMIDRSGPVFQALTDRTSEIDLV